LLKESWTRTCNEDHGEQGYDSFAESS
jgi:hypothetical protein